MDQEECPGRGGRWGVVWMNKDRFWWGGVGVDAMRAWAEWMQSEIRLIQEVFGG